MTQLPPASVEQRLRAQGLQLPQRWRLPGSVRTAAQFVRRHGQHLTISGHLPLDAAGHVCGPFGKVGAEVSPAAATAATGQCFLAMLASLTDIVESLSAVRWQAVRGYVNSDPAFFDFAHVLNGCSDLMLALYGDDAGGHSRIAVGVAGLPFNCCVEIEAEAILI